MTTKLVCVIVLSALVIGVLSQKDDGGLLLSALQKGKIHPVFRQNGHIVTDTLTSQFIRRKRQHDFASSMANANAYGQYFGQNGFGYSAANAGAGAFMNQGPLGYMGASNANAASQNMNFGPGGVSASGAHTMTHEYDMFGKKVIVSNAAGFSVANGASSVTKSGSVSVA